MPGYLLGKNKGQLVSGCPAHGMSPPVTLSQLLKRTTSGTNQGGDLTPASVAGAPVEPHHPAGAAGLQGWTSRRSPFLGATVASPCRLACRPPGAQPAAQTAGRRLLWSPSSASSSRCGPPAVPRWAQEDGRGVSEVCRACATSARTPSSPTTPEPWTPPSTWCPLPQPSAPSALQGTPDPRKGDRLALSGPQLHADSVPPPTPSTEPNGTQRVREIQASTRGRLPTAPRRPMGSESWVPQVKGSQEP